MDSKQGNPASGRGRVNLAPGGANHGARAIREALRHRYANVANRPEGQFQYPIGRGSVERLNYRRDFLDRIPSDVAEHFVGVGNPFAMGNHCPAGTSSIAEDLPVESGWADLVISNGVLNLATCKPSAFAEAFRVLKPGAVPGRRPDARQRLAPRPPRRPARMAKLNQRSHPR